MKKDPGSTGNDGKTGGDVEVGHEFAFDNPYFKDDEVEGMNGKE